MKETRRVGPQSEAISKYLSPRGGDVAGLEGQFAGENSEMAGGRLRSCHGFWAEVRLPSSKQGMVRALGALGVK